MKGALAVLALLLASCGGQPECIDRLDCGALAICEDEVCKDVQCVAITDCGIGEYCDPDANTCEPGCESADGCIAGEDCVEHECVAYGCRSTPLDCAIGQQCDEGTGECHDAAGCEACSGPDSTECGSGVCVGFDSGGIEQYHCILPCLVVDDPEGCPRGLECRDLSGEGDLFCYADCPSYQVEASGG